MESLVIVHNVAKRHNIGTLARSATAFGVSELILVGRKDFNAFGSHGSTLHVNFRHFYSLQQAQQYLKERLTTGVFYSKRKTSRELQHAELIVAFINGHCHLFVFLFFYFGGATEDQPEPNFRGGETERRRPPNPLPGQR